MLVLRELVLVRIIYDCYFKLEVLFVDVLVTRALLFGVCIKALIFGNSHAS